jgi:hypothetical protein
MNLQLHSSHVCINVNALEQNLKSETQSHAARAICNLAHKLALLDAVKMPA